MMLSLSRFEVKELLKAWIALSLAFAIAMRTSWNILPLLGITLFTVGAGFVVHELAHKFVAGHFRLKTEFRANTMMLLFALATSLVGFIFAAPGGVYFSGMTTKDRYGKISLSGPAANIVLAFVFLAVHFLSTGGLSLIGLYGYHINAFLALFNLLPLPGFDGAKVYSWNKAWFFVAIVLAGAMTFAAYLLGA